MELVRDATAVRKEQEPEPDLRDEQCLAGGEHVRVHTPGIPLAEEIDPAPSEREQVHEDDGKRVRLVQSKHGREP